MSQPYTYRGYRISPSSSGRSWDVLKNVRGRDGTRFHASGFKTVEEAEEKVDELRRAARRLARLEGRLSEGV